MSFFAQLSGLLSYIYLFQPEVILLDEPDSHLHPNNQRALVSLLSRLANERATQILMATHSRHVIDALRDSAKQLWVHNGELKPETEYLDVLLELVALDSAEGLLRQGVKYVL
ncbi:MAG: ABC transporter ATP-binding protein, partial [Cyanobacteria bacterium J06636_16]